MLAHFSESANTNNFILEAEELGHNATKPLNES